MFPIVFFVFLRLRQKNTSWNLAAVSRLVLPILDAAAESQRRGRVSFGERIEREIETDRQIDR